MNIKTEPRVSVGVSNNDASFVICDADGRIISKNGIKTRKAATQLDGASLFDYVDIGDANKLTALLSGGTVKHLRLELRRLRKYRYAFAEISDIFGERFAVVYLFGTQKDFSLSDLYKTRLISPAIAEQKKISASKTDQATVFSDTSSFEELVKLTDSFREIPEAFPLRDVTSRIVRKLSSAAVTDCKLKDNSDPAGVFITKRDRGYYIKLVCALIFVLTKISASRKIAISTECFSGCARVIIGTDTAVAALHGFRSADIYALAEIVPETRIRLLIADIIAARTGVAVFAECDMNGHFVFSLTVSDTYEQYIEFKHPQKDTLNGDIDRALTSIFGYSVADPEKHG